MVPEHASVEAFGEFLLDSERSEFTYQEAEALAEALGHSTPVLEIRALKGYGFKMQPREPERVVRGFLSNPHNRWSAYPSHGGSGWEQITGFGGQEG